ncbi:MAG: hypothetical protein HY454_00350 [Parcubacteria group bacterium]|nr:hypothetical protein [Parcubacteria group bacterium]
MVLVGFFQFSFAGLADPDSLYHITHAKIYLEQGFFDSSFPWLQYSVINKYQADIWYGFHILLVPFTFFSNGIFGIKLAGVLIAVATLAVFFAVLKKLGARWPFFWTALLFFSIPDVHYRLLMMRPHNISFALGVAVFYLAVANRRPFLVVASAFAAFFHLALAWLPLAIVGAVELVRLVQKQKPSWRNAAAVAVGSLAGLALRPNFLGALKLAYIQVVQLMIEKLKGTVLPFGSELKPGNHWTVVAYEFVPIMIILALAVWGWWSLRRRKLFFELNPQRQLAVWSSLVLAVVFGFTTFFVARRAIDLWVGFSFIFAALVWGVRQSRGLLPEVSRDFPAGFNLNTFLRSYKSVKMAFSKARGLGALVVIIVMAITSGIVYNTLHFASAYKKQSPAPTAFQDAAAWLKENSDPGDVVFNIHWDNFPMLFFWNQQNYYVNGMDPIFEYAFSRELYLKHYFMDIDKIFISQGEAYTCGSNPCGPEAVASVYDVLKNDFKAKYIFVQIGRNPVVFKYLDSNPHFNGVFTNGKEAIFEVL